MDKGLKRLCASCGTKFYDFNKSPIICPSCDTEFTGVVKIRTRRSRLLTADTAKPAGLDEETTEVEAENDNISLDDLATEEDSIDEDEDTDVDLDDLDDDTDEDDDDFDDDDEDLDDLDEEEEDAK